MLETTLGVWVPVLVFLLMTVVGLELTAPDFRRAAACPSGGMANFYTYLGRGNLALAVTLTATSCLVAVVTMPVVLAALRTRLDDPAVPGAPAPLVRATPGAAGPPHGDRAGRSEGPAGPRRPARGALLGIGLAALAALITLVLAEEWDRLAADFTEISLAVVLLTGIMITTGFVTGRAAGLDPRDRIALAMVLAVRNVGVAVTALGRTEFAVFATAYFLNQVPLLLAAVALARTIRTPDPSPGAGTAP